MTVGATGAVHELLAPDLATASIRRLPDGAMIALEGRLVREAEPLGRDTRLMVAVKRAGLDGGGLGPTSGLLRITTSRPGDFRLGDTVRARGRMWLPRNFGNPGEFDYEAYMARQGIAATMTVRGAGAKVMVLAHHPIFPGSWIESIRRRIGAFIDASLAPPFNAEMRALVIGDRGGIDEALRQKFALSGMAHLLVISGLHLSFVAGVTFALARFCAGLILPGLTSRGYANKIAALATAAAVGGYGAIAGHHISTLRALIMVLSYVLAVALDRSREVLASLGLAAAVICIALPGSTADIGFQLSFASVVAIVLGMGRFRQWWEGSKVGRQPSLAHQWGYWALGYIAVSFYALVGTAPLTAYHFNQFSLVGLVANAAVVPVMGFAGTICGLLASLASFIFPAGAQLLIRLGGVMLQAGTAMAGWFVRWPAAWTRIFTPTILELGLVYSLIALWLTGPMRAAEQRTSAPSGTPVEGEGPMAGLLLLPAIGRRLKWRAILAAGLMLVLATDAAWWAYDRFFNPDLRVTFLSIGQGDAAVVRFPGSRVMLIDGGGVFGFDRGERIVAPYLWSRKIMHVDYLALSHPELDHFGGFAFIARNFRPSEFWTTASTSSDAHYRDLLAVLAQAAVGQKVVDSSLPPSKIADVALSFLNPPPGLAATRNDSSMVLRLSYGATSFLFAGDIEAQGERAMVERTSELGAWVIKVPHHGSQTSSTPSFIRAAHPRVAVISAGYLNRFNFPAPSVVQRYRDSRAQVFETDLDGAITVDADGQSALLQASRSGKSLRITEAGRSLAASDAPLP